MAGSIAGAFLSGDKPKIPLYPTINFGEEITGATADNLRALPGLEKLASRVNEFSSTELMKGLERAFPGYASILAKGTETLKSEMRGELPEDVQRNIGRVSAERARSGGYAGSEFSGNLEARDLGLTRLNLINQSLSTAEHWFAQAASRAPQFDFTKMLLSPRDRIDVHLYENQQRFQRDLLAARVKAMPEPWETALKNFFDNVEETGQAALGAYAGASMGGMGGGGKTGGGGSSGGAWAYEGSTQFANAPAPQLNDVSGTYFEPAVESYDLGPEYFQPTDSYSGHPAWWP